MTPSWERESRRGCLAAVTAYEGVSMKKIAVVEQKVCVACGACMKVCPKCAVKIVAGCFASVDGEKCVGCGLCAKTCPAGCIEAMERGSGI